MTFKNYSNPLYDVVENPDDWTQGLCCIFAYALQERFGLPMKALLVKSTEDETDTLVHAFGVLPNGDIVDALGIRPEGHLLEVNYADYSERTWRELHGAKPGETIQIVIEPVTLGQLWALNPEDHEATNAAHLYIEQHPELFSALSVDEGGCYATNSR
jgi:hypothetical protein